MNDTVASGDLTTSSFDASGWSATVYREVGSFAYSSEATAPILQLLDAQTREKILDLGCGSGEVTAEIVRLVGREGVVVGVDMSEDMIVKAREKTMLPDMHLVVGDIQDPAFLEKLPPDFVGKCDKIFSSAALHWCKRDPVGVLMNSHKILKTGGLFVAEMGGHGNVSGVRDALHTALHQRGIDPVARDPWFFPVPDEYTELLKLADFRPLSVSLHPRPTTVADLGGWIRLFGRRFLEGIGPEEEQDIVNEVVETCRMSGAWREDRDRKLWVLEYVRLRVVAMKGDIRS